MGLPLKHIPKLSVVLPVYNAQNHLEEAIRSCLNQTFEDFELLIVDDGSTDRSVEIATSFVDPRLRCIRQPHRGLVPTLNAGLELSSAQLIARMDADDVCLPLRFKRQVDFLEENPSVSAVSCMVEHGGDPITQKGYGVYIDWINQQESTKAIERALLIESPFAHPSMMFRGSLVQSYGPYRDGLFPEDYELWLRWAREGVVMAKIRESLLVWNDPPERLSRNDMRYDPMNFFKIKIPYLSHLLEMSGYRGKTISLWGGGRIARKKMRLLMQAAFKIDTIIDIDPSKQGRRFESIEVISPHDLPKKGAPIISLVSSRGARSKVRQFLLETGREEMKEFFIA